MKKLFLFLVSFFFLFRGLAFADDLPNYQGYVNDFAHVLSPNTINTLNAQLSALEKKTTDQIAVVTIDSTNGDPIEDYSIHLADKWKVGQKGKDNGVIMLFAMKDRRMRIEVGRGLEGDLTDVQSKHIQTDIIAPEFKAGNYDAGVTKGVNAVITTITHEQISGVPLSSQSPATSDGLDSFVVFLVILFVLIAVVAFSPHTPLGGRGTWFPTVFWGGGNNDDDGGGFGGFGGGSFSGGGSSSSW